MGAFPRQSPVCDRCHARTPTTRVRAGLWPAGAYCDPCAAIVAEPNDPATVAAYNARRASEEPTP